MKKLMVLLAGFMMMVSSIAFADTYVRGYTKSNGTYVAPHYRSSPDSSYNNNWSVKGNTNPYTGKSGTKSRTYNDKSPYSNSGSYGYGSYGNDSKSKSSNYGW